MTACMITVGCVLGDCGLCALLGTHLQLLYHRVRVRLTSSCSIIRVRVRLTSSCSILAVSCCMLLCAYLASTSTSKLTKSPTLRCGSTILVCNRHH